jgi:hypothetical protein
MSIGTAVLVLASWTRLLMIDLDKAREVLALETGQAVVSTREIELPQGEASIRVVARGYDCRQPLDGTMEVTVQSAKRQLVHHELRLDQLIWYMPSGADCIPVGYLRLDDEEQTRPLEFAVRRGDNPITFTLKMTQAANPGRPVTIWVVYNDRTPTWRMLGEKQ